MAITAAPQNKKKIKKLEVKIHLNFKKILLWLFIILMGISFLMSFTTLPANNEISLSQLINDVKGDRVKKILVEEERLSIEYNDESFASSRKEPGQSLIEIFKDAGIDPNRVEFSVKDTSFSQIWLDILGTFLPLVFMALFFFWIFKQARGAQEGIFSFGRSKAKLFAKGKQNLSFNDVAGVEEAKKELEEVVDFLKHPGKYRALGARTPKGVILVGPSGTGKTLLAKAVAGEAGVPFFSMAGSEFMEMLVGVGASRTRDLFSTAKKAAPSIIFIDEIDAIGRHRGNSFTGGHDEREQTLNQILVEMDGFAPNESVIVLAASVTGETPILVKENDKVRLLPIGEFVDQFYDGHESGEVSVKGVEALGFEKAAYQCGLIKKNLYFKNSAYKKVSSVFRHRVNHIYEIEYLGGRIRATENHSVFVRNTKGIETRAVANLKKGDILVNLPYKANRTNRKRMEVRAHRFDSSWSKTLPLFNPQTEEEWEAKHLFALESQEMSQSQIAQIIGVSQKTVSHWQRQIGSPRAISRQYFKHHFPKEIKVTPQFCRLLGYYVAEGYARHEVDFCFSIKESEMMADLVSLMEKALGIQPDQVRHITPGAVNIVYSAAPLAKFLIRHCGKGARNKHVPEFLFEAPYKYFIEFLRGVWRGDGFEDKRGKGEITSVSKRLILELNWLCRMHGMKTYVRGFTAKEGRRIKNGHPLKAAQAYRLGWGKTSNPFNYHEREKTFPIKRPIVQRVKKLLFKGFVYDLCGVDNEAFFGGESPVLLHNTNRGDLLDPALLRPGRFDRRVVLDMPDIEDRKAILAIHARGKPFVKEMDWDKASRRTVGFSGADLENMLNEAAIRAARKGQKAIDMEDIEDSALKVKLGPEKKRLQSDDERKMTAYHEGGHAVVSHSLSHMDPVHRISIVSRGVAMGFTMIPPQKDRYNETRSHLLETVTSLLGGRAAEELIFNEFTAGAASDIDKATRVARQMVINLGMSSLGPIYFGPQVDMTEWGRSWIEPTQISPQMQAKVDREIKKIIDGCYEEALGIIKKNRQKLDKVADELLKKETLESEEFEVLMRTEEKKKKKTTS